jgi:ABC-type uncharacterized transport system involved in gliding motility auxiliary subunit
VRAGLDENIKNLGTALKIINIIAVPALLAALALLIAAWRRRGRRARPAPGESLT